VLQEAQRILDVANARLSRPEQIKRFRLLTDEWSVDSGHLTPTMKVRRRAILERYTAVVDALYDQPNGGS
jgi:long-chain acyl-CoA synthetase